MIRVLALGDVVSDFGCKLISRKLFGIRKKYEIDLVICNGENSDKNNGISPDSADTLFTAGVDIITGGNHSYKRREIYDYLDDTRDIIRPENYPPSAPGVGYTTTTVKNTKVAVINLLGTMYLESLDNPFIVIDDVLEKLSDCSVILLDFHAEATSEKTAMGFYLDGRVSAVFGTHTHIQTADERILKKGTGYITDLGMCGCFDSVLGVKKDIVINKFINHLPVRFEPENTGESVICGAIFDIDEKTGCCIDVQRLMIRG